MPHQCTNCGHTFADGSKEMLSGCPECGGNKFQFYPGEIPDDAGPDDDAAPPERSESSGVSSAVGKAAATVRDFVNDESPPSPSETAGDGDVTADADAPDADAAADDSPPTADASSAPTESETEGETTGTPGPDGSAPDDAAPETGAAAVPDAEGDGAPTDDTEDAAQASARSEMVTSDDLPSKPPSEGRVVKEPDEDADQPDMEALREELNDQFESIKVLAPGQYELNLMELYDREEYIIALQENGRYVIEVPETFAGPTDPGDDADS